MDGYQNVSRSKFDGRMSKNVLKNSLVQIYNLASIFPVIDRLPLPKSMISLLKDDVYGDNPFLLTAFSQESPKISKYAYRTKNSFPFRDFGRCTAFPTNEK